MRLVHDATNDVVPDADAEDEAELEDVTALQTVLSILFVRTRNSSTTTEWNPLPIVLEPFFETSSKLQQGYPGPDHR